MTVASPNRRYGSRLGSAKALREAWEAWDGTFGDFIEDLDARQIPYLSHTKVALASRCPKCYCDQYVLGINTGCHFDAMTTGLLFHQAAATFYEVVQAGGGEPTTPEAVRRLAPPHPNPAFQPHLENALETLLHHAWRGHEVVAVEEIFFLDLAPGIPPVIGIIDLVLRKRKTYVVVDHKTSKYFSDYAPDQLALYAEHVRRTHGASRCLAAFDKYRIVPNLTRVRKPVFQRDSFLVRADLRRALIANYQKNWLTIRKAHRTGKADGDLLCEICHPSSTPWWR